MFKKDDIVEAFGTRGVVKSIYAENRFVEVKFEGAESSMIFHMDGRIFKWAKEPSLKLVTE